MAKINVHIYPTEFRHESRILKETKSIVESGLADQVLVVAKHRKDLPETEAIDANRTVLRIASTFSRFSKNLLFESLAYFELLIRVVWRLKGLEITHINVHSLSVLPTAVALKLSKRAQLIYDPHELETERAGLNGLRKVVSKFMERTLMPFVSSIVVVSPSIQRWYEANYPGKPVYLIRNMPDGSASKNVKSKILRKMVSASDGDILFIYQGLFGPGRGLEMILQAFTQTSNKEAHCVFMGNGALQPVIQEAAKNHNNIHLIPPVEPSQVLSYSSGADIGLSVIENCCLSYHYCLPNKFFEYIAAGIPIIVSPCPDQAEIIAINENGWVIEESTDALIEFLNKLTSAELGDKKRAAKAIINRYNWQDDAKTYASIFA